MKTAREMFEELGYEEVKITKSCIRFKNNNFEEIEFDRLCGEFIKMEFGYDATQISMKELQAINQMCHELGWLE